MGGGDPSEVLTRAARGPDLVLRYADHADGIIDVHLPTRPSSPDHPVVVLLMHGGFWRAEFDRRHTRPLAEGLTARGITVLTPEYRRTGAPGGGWPGTFDDVAAAFDALPRLLDEAGVGESGAVVIMGHSAGGHLALWAAARHRLPTSSRWHAPTAYPFTGVVSLAGVGALAWAANARLDRDAALLLVGATPEEAPDRYAQVDPTALLPLGLPLALVHGTEDQEVPVVMSLDLAAHAKASGDHVRLRVLDGVEHYALIDPSSAAWPDVWSAVTWALGGGSPAES